MAVVNNCEECDKRGSGKVDGQGRAWRFCNPLELYVPLDEESPCILHPEIKGEN